MVIISGYPCHVWSFRDWSGFRDWSEFKDMFIYTLTGFLGIGQGLKTGLSIDDIKIFIHALLHMDSPIIGACHT